MQLAVAASLIAGFNGRMAVVVVVVVVVAVER